MIGLVIGTLRQDILTARVPMLGMDLELLKMECVKFPLKLDSTKAGSTISRIPFPEIHKSNP